VLDLDAMWLQADAVLLRCLELAHQSFLAGGLPVGSVIVAGSGEQVSEGRNRVYDPAGGADLLQRTPIAHAEMNALAGADTPGRSRRHDIVVIAPALHDVRGSVRVHRRGRGPLHRPRSIR
jgi:tRNA(Arg) A34 adenosine deaminase TadA